MSYTAQQIADCEVWRWALIRTLNALAMGLLSDPAALLEWEFDDPLQELHIMISDLESMDGQSRYE